MSTPELVTMHLRNNKMVVGFFFGSLLVIAFLLAGGSLIAQPNQTASSSPGAQAQGVHPTPLPQDVDGNDPALPVWMRPATPVPAAASTPAPGVPAKSGPPVAGPDVLSPGVDVGTVTKKGNAYSIRVQSEEVTLQATVMDTKRRLVTSLAPTNFEVYEDGQAQRITSFRREDVPVSIGIVVDNSGS